MSRIAPRIEQNISGNIDGDAHTNSRILPLTEQGITYTLSHILREDPEQNAIVGQDLFVTATDETSAALWRTKYFSKEFEPGLETDIQEIYPVDFFIDGEILVIKHEYYDDASGIFTITKKDGRVTSGL